MKNINLFLMQNFKDKRQQVVGFKSPFFRVYKSCGVIRTYRYQFRLYVADRYVTICKTSNKCKLFNRYSLSLITILVNILFVPTMWVIYIPSLYFEGGYRFITDSFFNNGVRFFNYVNMGIIILLLVLLFFN